jgi:nucleoid DNA-binding protein
MAKKATGAITKPFTKTEVFATLAEQVELPRKKIAEVFEALSLLITRHLKKGAAEEFTLPGLLKMKVAHKPATKERKGTNPFTGEPAVFKAKPASKQIKAKPLKKLKDEIQ